jgi:Tol biopolymer transport system component
VHIWALVALAGWLSLSSPGAAAPRAPRARPPATERISVSTAGAESNGDSCYPAPSADGRSVAFSSLGDNLVISDTNGLEDIFVRDRATGQTARVSLGLGGAEPNGWSSDPVLSADGRFVAFHSAASNLVISDTNGVLDAFVFDRLTGTTERVSVSSAGGEGNGASDFPLLSADGRIVLFRSLASNLVVSDTNGVMDIFVRDRAGGETVRISLASDGSEANGPSDVAALSADGGIAAFSSFAGNLVAGDTNAQMDVFVRDLAAGLTTRASVDSAGQQALGGWSNFPHLSADGAVVAFASLAANLVAGDTNGEPDVFVHVRASGQTTRVNVSSAGAQALGGSSGDPQLSADAGLVAFTSVASNLIPGDTNGWEDVFVHDRLTGLTLRASVDAAGGQAEGGWSGEPALRPDGRELAFGSLAGNLVPGDTNGKLDAFVRQLGGYRVFLALVRR